MKRGKPMKRTPLKRGDSKLKSNKGLNKRSAKMEDTYVERRQIVKEMLEANKECIACIIYYVKDTDPGKEGVVTTNTTQDIHELVNRSQGGSITERMNLLAVCRKCHSRITTQPKEAEMLGLHLESWCNNKESFDEAERVRTSWRNGIETKPRWM